MASAVYSSLAANFGTEDAMETSSDVAWQPHESDEIDIDSNFTNVPDDPIDEDMAPLSDDATSAIPMDRDDELNAGPEPSDAPMNDGAKDFLTIDAELEEIRDVDLVQVNSANGVNTADTEEDLLDEPDDATSPAEQLASTQAAQSENSLTESKDANDPPSDLVAQVHTISRSSQVDHLANSYQEGKALLTDNDARSRNETTAIEDLENATAPLQQLSGADSVAQLDSQVQAANLKSSDAAVPDSHQNGLQEGGQSMTEHQSPHHPVLESSDLHSVIVVYGEQEFALFPSTREGSERSNTCLLGDPALARGGMLNLLSACREAIQDEIDENEELEISIDELDLKVRESSIDFPNVSFARIVELFVQLHRNDKHQDPPPLLIYLYTVTHNQRWWRHLLALEAGGMGISAISATDEVIQGGVQSQEDKSLLAEYSNLTSDDDAIDSVRREHGRSGSDQVESIDPRTGAETSVLDGDLASMEANGRADYDRGSAHVHESGDLHQSDIDGQVEEPFMPERPDPSITDQHSSSENHLQPSTGDNNSEFNDGGLFDSYDRQDPDQEFDFTEDPNGEDQTRSEPDDPRSSPPSKAQSAEVVNAPQLGDHVTAEEPGSGAIHEIVKESLFTELESQETPQDNETIERPNTDLAERKSDINQVSEEYIDVFDEADPTETMHPQSSETENQKIDDIFTDAEYESSRLDHKDSKLEAGHDESRVALQEEESILDDEDWTLGTEAGSGQVVTASPGSHKRARSLDDEGGNFTEREEKSKRSRAH